MTLVLSARGGVARGLGLTPGASLTAKQWVVAAFLLALGSSLLLGGRWTPPAYVPGAIAAALNAVLCRQ